MPRSPAGVRAQAPSQTALAQALSQSTGLSPSQVSAQDLCAFLRARVTASGLGGSSTACPAWLPPCFARHYTPVDVRAAEIARMLAAAAGRVGRTRPL